MQIKMVVKDSVLKPKQVFMHAVFLGNQTLTWNVVGGTPNNLPSGTDVKLNQEEP